ncbi:DNA primase TraC, partial [gut metagenome]
KGSDWKKGWIGGESGYSGLPQNVGGRNYSGSNSFFLQMQTALMGYQLPVYLTFKQAHNLKAHVLKGEKAFPVVYWDMLVKDKNGKKVNADEYRAMSKEEKKDMDVIPFFKSFPVYNIDQTNLAEVQPERVQKLKEKFKMPELRDTQGMYVHPALDRMIDTQGWLCPIQADKRVDGAFYSPTQDIVVLPMKEQFNIGNTPEEIYRGGMEFYSTMLHEISHSTMTPERLNREMGGRFGDPKYAKEELVAELTAAMISHSMGFDSKVTDNSAAYLDSWISVLKQEPKFIVSVMADVNKSSEMILDHVDKQRLALNEQPYLTKNDPFAPLGENEEVPFKNAAIVKTKSGDYAIRASYDGVELGLKKVSKDTAKTYFQLTDYKDKAAFLNMTAHKT